MSREKKPTFSTMMCLEIALGTRSKSSSLQNKHTLEHHDDVQGNLDTYEAITQRAASSSLFKDKRESTFQFLNGKCLFLFQ